LFVVRIASWTSPRWRWLKTGLVIGVVVALGLSLSLLIQRRLAGKRLVATAGSKTGLSIGCLGRIEPASRVRRLVPPTSLTTDRLTALRVSEGERVESDQLLGWFGDRDVRVAAVHQAEAELALAEAKLEQVKAGAKKGDIAAAEAQVTRAQAAELNAQRELDRLEKLAREKVVSPSEIDTRRSSWEMAQAERRAAEHTLTSLAEVRRVDVQVAEAGVTSARAALEYARAELSLSELRAPVAGTVLKIHTWPGERAGTEGVLEIGNLDELHVVAEVYETDVMRVRCGQTARILVTGLANPLHGEVVEVGWEVRRKDVLNTDPVADIDARVVEVRVRVNSEDAPKLARLTNLQVQVVIEGD
jgi:HlyD family secretion protein